MAKIDDITVGITAKVNWQEVYDDLVIEKRLIQAKLDELAFAPEVCTHPLDLLTSRDDGLIYCRCGVIVNKGKHPYVGRQ